MAKAYVYNLENEAVETILIGTPENVVATFSKTWGVENHTLMLGTLPAGIRIASRFKTIEVDGSVVTFQYELTSGGTLGVRVSHASVVKCNFCEKSCEKSYVDGLTKANMWAEMCDTCHKKYGTGLGIGRGQRYERVVIE